MATETKLSSATQDTTAKEPLPTTESCRVCGKTATQSMVIYKGGHHMQSYKIIYLCDKHHDLWQKQQAEGLRALAERKRRQNAHP